MRRPPPIPAKHLATPSHKADPFPYYRRLRDEAPIVEVVLPDRRRAWLVSRYDDVAAALKDARLVKDQHHPRLVGVSKRPWLPSFFEPLSRNMLDVDEPDHTRLRTLVSLAFTPRAVHAMTPRIERLCDGLLERARRPGFDLIRDYALPIPTTVISEMLGVPERHRGAMTRWSSAIVAADTSRWAILPAIPSGWRFLRYLRRLVRERRAGRGDDLLTALIDAEQDDDRLDEDELFAMCFLLLVAGHETTVNLIGNGVLALIDHPTELERLAADPVLADAAVEELLRFTNPLLVATERYACEDVELGGVTIPRGALVLAGLASANRDERRFQNPDRLDLGRDPNRHLAFGLGAHFCLGASLARLEARIALQALLRARPRLRLGVPRERLRWKRGLVLRGLRALPVMDG